MLQTSAFDSAATHGLDAPARLLTSRTHATRSPWSDAGRSRTGVRLWIIQGGLAALGLAIIMIGATTITMLTATMAQALVPFVVGVLAVHVAYSRRRPLAVSRVQAQLRPHKSHSRPAASAQQQHTSVSDARAVLDSNLLNLLRT